MPSESETQSRIEAESTVDDSYGTTIPPEVGKALGQAIEPGDTVRWTVSDQELSLEIAHKRDGALADAAPFDGPEWDGEKAAESTWS